MPTSDSTPIPLEAAAVEDAVVGADVELVGALQSLAVAVEGVGVLHHELACPQHAGAQAARLIALLGLEMVEQPQEVSVGADLAGDVIGQRLLVRHREHELGAASVAQPRKSSSMSYRRCAPQLGWLEHRHQHLPAPIASSSSRTTCSTLRWAAGRRQPGPHAGTQLAREAGPHDEPVGHRLGVGRRLLDRRQEVARGRVYGRV